MKLIKRNTNYISIKNIIKKPKREDYGTIELNKNSNGYKIKNLMIGIPVGYKKIIIETSFC